MVIHRNPQRSLARHGFAGTLQHCRRFSHNHNLEGAMSLSTDHRMPHLPKRLPVGSVYVVEGRVGQQGRLHVSSRYLVMPSGEKLDIPVELARTRPARGATRRLFGRHSPPSSQTKRYLRAAKKISLGTGTRRQERR
jgi:hypothetical protein